MNARINEPINRSVHPSIHPSIHSPTHPASTYPSTHPSINVRSLFLLLFDHRHTCSPEDETKLERPLQLPQASPQLLPNCRLLRPRCPSQLVKEWTVLEYVAHCLLNLTTLVVWGWERSSASGACAVSACSVRFLA